MTFFITNTWSRTLGPEVEEPRKKPSLDAADAHPLMHVEAEREKKQPHHPTAFSGLVDPAVESDSEDESVADEETVEDSRLLEGLAKALRV